VENERVKFSFVNPSPNENLPEWESRRGIAAWPPLGILYLATTLRERGVEVSVLDQPAKGLTLEETVNWVERENPEILGLSTFASSIRTAGLLSERIKKRNPNVVTVLGGYSATFSADRILKKYPSVDIVVRGEGEDTVVDLVKCLRKKDSLKDVLGVTFRDGGAVASTPDRPLIADLDSVSFPDRSLIDVEYHSIVAGAQLATKKFTSVVSSRGCTYGCRFCTCQKFALRSWRSRSAENVLDELRYLAAEGFQQFIFVDDNFTLNQKRVIELCKGIRQEKLDIEWLCEGRVDNCSPEMLKELSKAGCKVVYFGIESATQRILDYYDKRISPEQSRRAVEIARTSGIDVIVGSFILGALDETREEVRNTLEFAKQLPIDLPQFNLLTAYPGMDIWDELKVKGLLNEEDHWEEGVVVSEACPSVVPAQEVKKMIHQASRDFFLRPSYILRQAGTSLGSSFRRGLLTNNLGRIRSIMDSMSKIQ
jgi:anaerobic magnesium-protoporphyrin IX monomethyl ester cyclase